MHEPDLTIRQVAYLADAQSIRAMTKVETFSDRMNELTTDNETLLNEVMRLRSIVEMLTSVVDDLDQRIRGRA